MSTSSFRELKFTVKKKKSIPFDFVLEELASKNPRTRPMFGCTAVYIGEKIVLILRDQDSSPADNGVWICTSAEHHESLRKDFPEMRSIAVFETPVTGWQVLNSQLPDFESLALKACELILRNDPRIGRVPKAKVQSKIKKSARLRAKTSVRQKKSKKLSARSKKISTNR